MSSPQRVGRGVALASILLGTALAATKITIGRLAHSTAVVADGIESAADVLASGIVFLGLVVAARPPDEKHPYGHGRFETLAGLAVGLLLCATGILLAWHSLQQLSQPRPPLATFAIWPLIASISIKSILAVFKLRYGRRIKSAALIADASNDAVDILSGIVALVAVGVTLLAPDRFSDADHYGGFAVGLLVVFLGARVVRETTLQLVDTMPDEPMLNEIRSVAMSVEGVLGVEKCYARKTGLQYHVDLHLEVDPDLTVRDSHEIAGRVKQRIKQELEWVADVLVHVEPWLNFISRSS